MEGHIVYQSKIKFKDSKNNWKCRWAILEKSDRNVPPEDENARYSNYTSLVVRKHKEGEVKMTIPLYYLCVVEKQHITDKKNFGIVLVVANKMDTGDTYLLQGDTLEETDAWLTYFDTIVGPGMSKFHIKLPKIVKWKYSGPGFLYFYEDQRFITITDDNKIPKYVGTWPMQLLRRYGGDDPNKFVFESGRRCFGGVNYYHVASAQAYDIKGLCNKVSSRNCPVSSTTGSIANTTIPGYADNEPIYRHHPGPGPRPRPGERPITVTSNGSGTSTASKRSSGSSTAGDLVRQQSLDRGVRPTSDTIDSGISCFRSSNNSILSNRSSGRESYCSDIAGVEEDSGTDTMDSRGPVLPLDLSKEAPPQDMYMVMQPSGAGMPPISETNAALADGEVYEMMRGKEGYTTLRTNSWQEVHIGDGNYMVAKSPLSGISSPLSPSHSPMRASPPSPAGPKPKLINYQPMSSPTSTQCPSDNYMNVSDHQKTVPNGNYVNIDVLSQSPRAAPAESPYMNIDTLSRNFTKSTSMERDQQLYTNLGDMSYSGGGGGGGGFGNYMNMSIQPEEQIPARRPSTQEHPIYDTPTNHVRAYANVDNKMIAMSVSNPIYGNTVQKVKT